MSAATAAVYGEEKEVPVTVERGGKRMYVKVTLGEL